MPSLPPGAALVLSRVRRQNICAAEGFEIQRGTQKREALIFWINALQLTH